MKPLSALSVFILLPLSLCHAQNSVQNGRMSRAEYIETYAPWAVKEMLISGVPASITLAQGVLESGDGNSVLATMARNHFGIKCHGWEGEKYYHDDDAKGECFRVYPTVYESYRDHSEFLRGRERYAGLFKLDLNDYKGWAHGLKRAGYATNPNYPEMLIKIIEENDLAKYDRMKQPPKGRDPQKDRGKGGTTPSGTKKTGHQERHEEAIVSAYQRQMYVRNNVRYVRVEEGDTYEKLERLMDVRTRQLMRYNDLPDDRRLSPGDILYLQPKRNRNRKHDFHHAADGETLQWISQEYGIKLNKLLKYNGMTQEQPLSPHQKVWLRKRKKGEQ